jgi:glycosyltransferase involved in cell wall biosynthesis
MPDIHRIVMLTPDIEIDRRIILEAQSLIREGKEVILIAGNDGRMPEYEQKDGIKIRRPLYHGIDSRLACFYRWSGSFFNLMSRIVNKMLGKVAVVLEQLTKKSGYDCYLAELADYYRPDVIHAHDLPMLPAAHICSKDRKIPLVYDSHELYTEEELPKSAKKMLKAKERKYIMDANVITVNPYLKKEFESWYGKQGISIIENATARRPDFDPDRRYDLFREEYALPSESRLLLYQGWFSPHRNLATLVKGMKYLDESCYLLLMGYGDYRDELSEIANDAGVSGNVLFVPAKSQEELLFYTASADIGLMPYLKSKNLNNLYSSPNKLYEFIAAGLPILANDLPYYHDIIEKFNNGIVRNIEDPESFAGAVKEMLSGDLGQFRQNARAAYAELNWERESEKLLKVYGELEKGQ